MSMVNVSIPDFLETRDALVHTYTNDDYLHISWKIPDGSIISFEYIPDSYPAGSLKLWESVDDYYNEIINIGWIKITPELKEEIT